MADAKPATAWLAKVAWKITCKGLSNRRRQGA